MLNLLKTDLKRLLKDKIILIGFLVTCALSLFTVVVFFGIEKILGGDEESIFAGLFTGRDTFLGSFSPSSNAGLMIPIFISVALIKDFRYGTVRNKIISGKSRIAIFMSDYFAGIIFGLIFYITSSLISLLLGSLLLGYGTKFNLDEFGLIMTTYGYGILNYLVFLSCAVFIAVITKNVGLSITVNIVGSFLLSIVALLLIPSNAFLTSASEMNDEDCLLSVNANSYPLYPSVDNVHRWDNQIFILLSVDEQVILHFSIAYFVA